MQGVYIKMSLKNMHTHPLQGENYSINRNANSFTAIFKIQFAPSTAKPVLRGHSKKTTRNGFQDRLSPNAGQKYCKMLQGEHSAIRSTFIKQPFVIKIFVLSILE